MIGNICVTGRFPFTKNFRKFLLGISVWEESVAFATSPICLQAPLRGFTKTPDALVKCSAIFSNMSLFNAFPSNKYLLCVVMRSLTSACSCRSRFTVVETSPVNEKNFQSCSCNILHGKRAPGKKLRISKNFYLPFPSNKCLLSACVVMRSLTSACSCRSRFTVVETSPVNEKTFQSCSCNILHGKRAPGKKASNKQEFLPTPFK